MRLLDILLAANVLALFLGNMGRFLTGVFIFPFAHLGVSVLTLYVCLNILFGRHAFLFTPPLGAGSRALRKLEREKRGLQGLTLSVLLFIGVVFLVGYLNNVAALLSVIYAVTLAEPFVLLVCAGLVKHYARRRVYAGEVFRVRSLISHRVFVYLMVGGYALGIIQALLFGGFYDYVKGFFVGAGAGQHVYGGIMAALVIVLIMRFWQAKAFLTQRALLRLAAIGAAVFMVALTDTKQLLAIALVLVALYILGELFSKGGGAVQKLGGGLALLTIGAGGWLYLGYFLTSQWAKIQLGVAWKVNTLSDVWRFGRGDALSFLSGFGPGQTVSKLSMMVSDYEGLFRSAGLDIMSSNITNNLWDLNQGYWVSNSVTGSSLFSQFFSWAGVVGDTGLLGLLAYLLMIAVSVYATRNSATAGLLWAYFILIGFAFMWLEESPLPVTVALLAAYASLKADPDLTSEDVANRLERGDARQSAHHSTKVIYYT